jgi:hypothetical protein
MSNNRIHDPNCTCNECLVKDDQIIVDLKNSINITEVYALNERVNQSCKKIFKDKEDMLDKNDFCESNEDDPELLINIPFYNQVSIKSMKLIGGEDGTAPSKVKLYVNCTNPDFDLLEGTPTYQIDTIENPDGTLQYNLPQFKFGAVWNLTIIVPTCIDSDHSKIYYIGFEGIATKKKRVAAINCQVEFFNSNKVPGLDEDRKTEKIGQI